MTQSTKPDGIAITPPRPLTFWDRLFNRTVVDETPLRTSVSFLSDVGCVRSNNEDSYGYASPTHNSLVAIVADGMGGHACGEYASQLAVETILQKFKKKGVHPADYLPKALLAANAGIFDAAKRDPTKKSMGTTCTAIEIVGRHLRIAHVGDSRLYMVRAERSYQLSQDHTEIAEMVSQGVLTAEEGKRHPDRNVLTRAVGTKPIVKVESWAEAMELSIGDILILCSDGLHDLVNDQEIERAAALHGERTCEELVSIAKSRGAPDNVTVGVIEILSNVMNETREEAI